jgi:hypothetical protein
VFVVERVDIRATAFAGTETGSLRFGRGGVEADILAAGASRRARWPAVDTGCFHANHELAIGAPVAAQHCLPTRIVVDEVLCSWSLGFGYGPFHQVILVN